MAAPTHTRPRSEDRRSAENPLSWWAIALPSLTFVVLLLLILNPMDPHVTGGDPALDRVLQSVQHSVLRQTP